MKNQETKQNKEEGVLVMKNGKAWGMTYSDGKSTCYGWIEPEYAPIHSEEYVKKPTSVTYEGSHYVSELIDADLVKVTRTTTIEIDYKENIKNEQIN